MSKFDDKLNFHRRNEKDDNKFLDVHPVARLIWAQVDSLNQAAKESQDEGRAVFLSAARPYCFVWHGVYVLAAVNSRTITLSGPI